MKKIKGDKDRVIRGYYKRPLWVVTQELKFLSLGVTVILGQMILYWGGCPVHGRMLSSTPSLYLLNASHAPSPIVTIQKIPPDIATCPPGSKNEPC